MNIVLTGLRGSGKSKIGRLLSKKLGYDFVDIDLKIEEQEHKTITKIVELRGWEYFRAVESKIAKETAKLDNTVIATGGGTILDRENEKALKKNGKIVYLYRKPEDCVHWIQKSHHRPPLTNKETLEEEMKELYSQRNSRYCESASLIFNRSDDIEKDSMEIIRGLRKSTRYKATGKF